jgi:hypothetical protein
VEEWIEAKSNTGCNSMTCMHRGTGQAGRSSYCIANSCLPVEFLRRWRGAAIGATWQSKYNVGIGGGADDPTALRLATNAN